MVATWLFIIADNVACVIAQVALICMKLAHNDQEKETRTNNRSAYLQWKWWLGILLEVVANGIHLVDAALIPIIVISASKATGIISGVVLSILWLKETFVWQFDVPAIALMTIGSVTMIL
jgi:hypothetical protein